MNYDFNPFKNELKNIQNWLIKEFSTIRTGMATPTLLDGIKVESYGTLSPINQIANIGIEDARTLKITPWDKSQSKEIEKAITDANLGVGLSTNDQGLRVSFPELTSERRVLLIKTAKDKLENARISLRSERDKVWSDIQDKVKISELTEDDKFYLKDEMQKLVDEIGKELEIMLDKKEKEISI
jgi:ribosome recycling factor